MHYGKKIRGKIKINNFKELKKTSSFFICKNKLYRYNYTYIIPMLEKYKIPQPDMSVISVERKEFLRENLPKIFWKNDL